MAANDMSAKARSRAQSAIAFSQRQVDRVMSPETRQKSYDSTTAFATERPILASFILVQLLFSFLPLLFFVGFAVSLAFVSLISAIMWSIFWIGIAMLFLVPTLFLTFSVAVLVWIWAVATFYAGRWVYDMMPVNVRGDMQVKMPNGKEVIFQKPQSGDTFDPKFDIKAEAAEIKD